MKMSIRLILSIIFLNCMLLSVHGQYDVKTFGAKGDGKKLDTRSIQSAIDKANANGGGTVEVSPGIYMIGTLILKDNV
jgi:polygalacturonase